MSDTNTDAFLAQLLTSVPLSVGFFLFFVVLRHLYPNSIEVRRSKEEIVSHGPISKKTWFYWVYEVWNLSYFDYFIHAGIDGLIFDLYLHTSLKICLISLPVACAILIPTYYNGELNDSDILSRISLTNLDNNSIRLYVTILSFYIFLIIFLYNWTQLYLKVAYIAREFSIGNEISCIKELHNIKWRNFYERRNYDISQSLNYIRGINDGTIGFGQSPRKVYFNNNKDNPNNTSFFNSRNVSVDKIKSLHSKSKLDGNDINDGNDNNNNNNENMSDNENKDRSEDVNDVNIEMQPTTIAGSKGQSSDSSADSTKKMSKSLIGNHGNNNNNVGNDYYDRWVMGLRNRINLYSIMITNLPQPFRNNPIESAKKLKSFFQALFPMQVQNVIIAPNVAKLSEISDAIYRQDRALNRLRIEGSDYERQHCWHLCGKRINGKEFHTNKRNKLVDRFKLLSKDQSLQNLAPVAFVTFKSLQTASVAASTPIRFGSSELNITRCDLHRPIDILWQNLPKNDFKTLQRSRNFILLLMILLLLFWSIPSAAIQGLANIRNIFSSFNIDLDLYMDSAFIDWLEGFLSIVLLHVWLTLIPNIVKLFVKQEYHTNLANYSISCMIKFYDCLLVMLLLVTAISGTVLTNIHELNDIDISNILTQFSLGLSEMSTYFAMYVLYKGTVGKTWSLLRVDYWFMKKVLKWENNEWSDNWNYWANGMIALSIVLCYCVMAPFIWLMGIIYFLIYIIIFRYQTIMLTFNKHEYGSYLLFPYVFNRIMIAVYISIFTLIILMALKSAIGPLILLLPLFIIIPRFHKKINKYFENDFNLTHINGTQRQDSEMLIADTDSDGDINNNGNKSPQKQDIEEYYIPPVLKREFNENNEEIGKVDGLFLFNNAFTFLGTFF